jgi:hypothetical protein
LVPSAYRAEGEADEFLFAYKSKWLTQLDFKHPSTMEAMLLLAVLLLARERRDEAEGVLDMLLTYGKPKEAGPASWPHIGAGYNLLTWLKERRGDAAARERARAQAFDKLVRDKDREWLSSSAAGELTAALERRRLDLLLPPIAGIARWLNDAGARGRAEAELAVALAAARTLMR